MEEVEAPVASTSKLGNCGGLDCSNLAKYSCPACSFSSCSLSCSKSHKLNNSCTGIAAPIWSKQIKATEWNWGSLMRDQSYISSIGRLTEETGKNLVGAGLIPKGRGDEANGVLDDRSDKEDKLVSMARSVGVKLVLLPKGMSKRNKNTSRWDLKEQRMEWTTEIIFQPRPPPSLTTEPFTLTLSISSTQPIHQILSLAMDNRDRKGKATEIEDDIRWSKVERDWLNSLIPPPVAETKIEGEEDSDDLKITVLPSIPTSNDSESPYLFLLVASSIPTFTAPSLESDSEDSNPAPTPSSSTSSKPSRPPPKTYYQPSITSTLSTALQGVTLLEFPTFEFWSRETFLRALAKNQIKILDPPAPFSPRVAGSNGWTRGGGRGRDRGGNRDRDNGGRGGRGGGQNSRGGRGGGNSRNNGSSNGWKDDGIEGGDRVSDNGWGKRRITEVDEGIVVKQEQEAGEERETKREKIQEIEIEIELVSNQENSNSLALEGYDSD